MNVNLEDYNEDLNQPKNAQEFFDQTEKLITDLENMNSEGLEKVRNESQQIKNDAKEVAFTQWLPGLESNQRPKA